MSSRQPRNATTPVGGSTSRQNEYFVPRDGIDREVISADICRYLGNDALVRPGHYENPQTGQVVQGYYITAYRNLTTAMIEDLKADSARWDAERRAQTSRNTSGGQYRHSEIHQSRQHHGPSDTPYQADPYARDSGYDGPRYPGTGAPGYTGASNYGQQGGYSAVNVPSGYGYQPPQQSPPPDPRYSASYQANASMNQFANPDSHYVHTGSNMNATASRGFTGGNDFPTSRTGSSAAPQQPVYATASASQSGYPTTTSPYPYSGQLPTSGGPSFPPLHAQDAAYGRASPGQTQQPPQSFATQGQQYGEPPSTRSSVPPPTSSSSSSNIRSDRDSDRHTSTSDRHSRQPRR
ncbi:hypothetical protein N3K66_000925 [Trichothecium roseum]|uniref:Uncharacterized protein n=1 Tax=Trichothecium roseum TaxID=47278 RepID=A0ACC0VD92_9HYPO|nr:hypothetical protein N3K66_000925 [Trichothecium roseum]